MDAEQAGEMIEAMRGMRRDITAINSTLVDNTRAITQMLVAMEGKQNKSECERHKAFFAETYVTQTEFAPYRSGVKWCAGLAASAVAGVVKLIFFGGSLVK